MGGALACLVAIELRNSYPTQTIELYTYGQPRVGDLIFSQNYPQDITYYRVVNLNDLFPHSPPQGQYEHAGVEIWYNDSTKADKYIVCEGV